MSALQKLPLTILHSFNKHSLLVPRVCLATPAPHQFSITSSRRSILVISLCIEKSWGAKGFCKNMFVLCDFFLRLWECLETKTSQNASATCTGMAKRGLCAILGDGICSYCACWLCLLFSVKFQIQNIEILIFLAFGQILLGSTGCFFYLSSNFKKYWNIDFSSFWQDLGLAACFFLSNVK